MKRTLYSSLVIVALFGLAGWTAYARLQRISYTGQTWEYKSIVITRGYGAAKLGEYLKTAEAFSYWAEDGKALAGQVNMISKSKELGDQGWELVSVTPLSSIASSQGSYAGFTDVLIYWFKRPK